MWSGNPVGGVSGSALRAAVAAVGVGIAAACAGSAASAGTTVLVDGLSNPRGITLGEDGSVYIAEAGSGGTIPLGEAGPGGAAFLGETGRILKFGPGGLEVVIDALPSIAPAGGGDATGPHDVAFNAAGDLFVVIGLGGGEELRDTAAASLPSGTLLGQLVQVGSGGSITAIADILDIEAALNPDGGMIDSNPYGLVSTPGGFFVADAGANAVFHLDLLGNLVDTTAFPPSPNPLPFGPPMYEAVPTQLAVAPDGTVLVAQLTGFPFPEGGAQVFALADAAATAVAGGLTYLTDLAVDADGTLYALEFDSDGFAGPGTSGALVRLNPDGSQTLIASGLVEPTGLAIDPSGGFYITTGGASAGQGALVHVVPSPAAAWAGLSLMLPLIARRRRGRTH